jgi:hypothetical protein
LIIGELIQYTISVKPSAAKEQKFTRSNIDIKALLSADISLATDAQEEVAEDERGLGSASSKGQDINSQPKDSEIVSTIKSIAEESLQISELSEMERTYSGEVAALLKQVIEPLNNTFHIKPTSLSKSDSSIQDVVLTPQGIVCIMHSHGTINSRPLESFSTEILLRVISEVIPEAKKLLVEKRQRITVRVGSLEKIAKEFRKLPTQVAAPRPGARTAKAQTAGARQAAEEDNPATPFGANQQQDALKASIIANTR